MSQGRTTVGSTPPAERDTIDVVLGEIETVMADVDRDGVAALVERLDAAQRVFVAGDGRSGLVAKAFAMRLMHLGLEVYVVGETITPAVRGEDTLVAVSGSGTTHSTVRAATSAADLGAEVLVLTTAPESELAGVARSVLRVPAATKARRDGEASTVQPLSSLFDQATHVVLDVVCLELAERRRMDNEAASRAHANSA